MVVSRKKMSGARLLTALGVTALLAGASVSMAGERPSQPAAGSGMQVAIDATGKLRQPTAAEAQALSKAFGPMLNRSAQSVQVTQFPDGTLSVKLGTEYLNVWLAAVTADGSLTQACIDNSNAAGAQLGGLEVK
jgi:hypothetical protein